MDIFKMSKNEFYKKKFPKDFFEKPVVSIMLRNAFFLDFFVSITFFY
jgi:hypothetical protein